MQVSTHYLYALLSCERHSVPSPRRQGVGQVRLHSDLCHFCCFLIHHTMRVARYLVSSIRPLSTVGLRRPVLPPTAIYQSRATSSKREAEIDIQGAANLFDEVELDGEEWEGEEIQEGVFISSPEVSSRPSRPPRNSIRHLNRLLSRHEVPDIPEEELEERFVRGMLRLRGFLTTGRGPGGQAINKTNSSVSLIHIPTGIRVQSQPTRSRAQNRVIARQILKERLDLMRARGELGGEEVADETGGDGEKLSRKEKLAAEARLWSKQELRWEKERRRKANRSKKVKRRKTAGDEDKEGEKSEGGKGE